MSDMVDMQAVIENAQQASRDKSHLTPDRFEWSNNAPHQRTLIAEYKARTPLSIRPNTPMDMHIPAYQSFDSDGSGDEQTFDLDHPTIDAPAVAEDVVVFRDGERDTSATVDYDADTVTVSDDGSEQEIEVFYLTSDQADLRVRITAPRNMHNEPIQRDAGMDNLRNTNEDPITYSPNHAFEGVIPTNWKVQLYLKAPYVCKRETDTGAEAKNLVLNLPIWEANEEIPGLEEAKKATLLR